MGRRQQQSCNRRPGSRTKYGSSRRAGWIPSLTSSRRRSGILRVPELGRRVLSDRRRTPDTSCLTSGWRRRSGVTPPDYYFRSKYVLKRYTNGDKKVECQTIKQSAQCRIPTKNSPTLVYVVCFLHSQRKFHLCKYKKQNRIDIMHSIHEAKNQGWQQ